MSRLGRTGTALRWVAVLAAAILVDSVLFLRFGLRDEWQLVGVGLLVGLYAWLLLLAN
jgi:hypothetical protein